MAEPGWYEVSLRLSGELAEAVAEVFSRFVEDGVAIESDVRYTDSEDEGTPYGPVKIYGYLPVNAELEEKQQKLEEALWHLSQIEKLPEPVYTFVEDQDWMNAWKAHYHPIAIGEKLMILPAWVDQNADGRIPLRIDPSMAFGTGTHPTTQLCLEMMERYVKPGAPVLDVGCGSGILSIAAVKLGASHALGVDIDPLAITATRENCELNGLKQEVRVAQGSVTEVQRGDFGLQQAPLVLANILAPVILRLFAAGLDRLVTPGGILVLSGILDTQAEEVRKAAEEACLVFKEQCQATDWVVLAFEKPNS